MLERCGAPRYAFDISVTFPLSVEIERELDGRWIAEVPALPGCLAYGLSQEDAVASVEALALRILAERKEHGEPVPDLDALFVVSP
jgi:predicted RNase H-like HicB family nuclease